MTWYLIKIEDEKIIKLLAEIGTPGTFKEGNTTIMKLERMADEGLVGKTIEEILVNHKKELKKLVKNVR